MHKIPINYQRVIEISEFRSQLEDLMLAEELLFDATSGFGSVYKRFLSHSIAHPAKMNTRLTEFLIERFTEKGDLVLDPMAGSGQTGVISALHGRDAVCVDIESKFFKWMERARGKVERQKTLATKGRIRNICGDARRLSELLKDADCIVTSPPYGEAQKGSGIAKRGYQGDKHSPTDLVGKRSYMPDKFENKENISTLPFGKVDVVVTSPPYADAKKGGEADEEAMAERWDKTAKERKWNTWGKTWKTEGRKRALKSLGSGYSESKENIGNLAFVDTVITSPPYERTACAERHWGKQEKYEKMQIIREKKLNISLGYSRSKNNIGNAERETYLSAMLRVYAEMFKVLKPQGKAIIIIKPFIRNKKVVDLPYHTWLLLKKAGFTLAKLFKLRLKTQSFWRILYHKKYPEVPQIKHEYILVCHK